ncbi:uncharacterized protein SAPINGB_P005310 [Magnusiomyces paraingens]|uniref:Uricase n=1 Tax=Magnusiomyces paraingens TaxID=2606893 RepID=A0A5E8BZE6_9ASCO|nr:uncharacterized protein SAPINGB_P005310 [Saprochaete ingens]VVT56823.1 unnamed protein product [Saprochaete ingens]
MSSSAYLASNTYGKDNVRLLKVARDPVDSSVQHVIELTVQVLLEGELEVAYTKADNSPVVPTDTVKNTIYILAKQASPWPIERFGATLTNHFVTKYQHISKATAYIKQHRWTRYAVDGKPHNHSFIQDGRELRTAKVQKTKTGAFVIESGIKDLTVLKSTGSQFWGYNKCEYTTLEETYDRILSTDVDAVWTWNGTRFANIRDVDYVADTGAFDSVYDVARNTTLRTFALENSASVQATMYNISEEIIKKAPLVDQVYFALPNKHYVAANLEWFQDTKNKGKDAEVFVPLSDPNGLIKSVVRRRASKL